MYLGRSFHKEKQPVTSSWKRAVSLLVILVAGIYTTYLAAESSDRKKRQRLELAANLYASPLQAR